MRFWHRVSRLYAVPELGRRGSGARGAVGAVLGAVGRSGAAVRATRGRFGARFGISPARLPVRFSDRGGCGWADRAPDPEYGR